MQIVDNKDPKSNSVLKGKTLADIYGKVSRPTYNELLQALTNIGCKYEKNENDGGIVFYFMGEQFHIPRDEGRSFVTIWKYDWYTDYTNDLDEINRIKSAVNSVNEAYGVANTYYIREAIGSVEISVNTRLFFLKGLAHLEGYLYSVLETIFYSQIYFYYELERLRLRENYGKLDAKDYYN